MEPIKSTLVGEAQKRIFIQKYTWHLLPGRRRFAVRRLCDNSHRLGLELQPVTAGCKAPFKPGFAMMKQLHYPVAVGKRRGNLQRPGKLRKHKFVCVRCDKVIEEKSNRQKRETRSTQSENQRFIRPVGVRSSLCKHSPSNQQFLLIVNPDARLHFTGAFI